MTNLQRFRAILGAMIMIIFSAAVIYRPQYGFTLVAAVLSIMMLLRGIRALVYYFTMARNMVGGKLQLFRGIILMDIGLFFTTLDDVPRLYVVIYLLIANAFSGFLDVLHALEAKRLEGAWKMEMAVGATQILSALACVVCIGRPNVLVYVYAGGLAYSAVIRLISAFRRTGIIYIP